MIKINQVTTLNQLTLLSEDTFIGCHLTKEKQSNAIDLSTLAAIRRDNPERKLSLSFGAGQFSLQEQIDILNEFHINYFEYTPVDFYIKAAFEAELKLLGKITVPKIANGFFVEADDRSLLDDQLYFSLLVEHGVAYFQFELNTALQADYRLSKCTLEEFEEFAAKFLCVVSDEFKSLNHTL